MEQLSKLLFAFFALTSVCSGFAQKINETKIGNQVWMSENFNVSHFKNGDTIFEVKTAEEWENAGKNHIPAWRYTRNHTKENESRCGKLYNSYAILDPRGLAPEGWHIPAAAEWKLLIKVIGGEKKAGKKMKSVSDWGTHTEVDQCAKCFNVDAKRKKCKTCGAKGIIVTENVSSNGDNSSGFNAYPTGYCDYSGKWLNDSDACWWSSSPFDNSYLMNAFLGIKVGAVYDNIYSYKCEINGGYSVRCVKN